MNVEYAIHLIDEVESGNDISILNDINASIEFVKIMADNEFVRDYYLNKSRRTILYIKKIIFNVYSRHKYIVNMNITPSNNYIQIMMHTAEYIKEISTGDIRPIEY